MPRMAIWNKLLELHLRRSNADAFQTFVNQFFGRVHGDAFVPIRPQGRRGDKGLDGFLAPGGTVYQCYGASNGESKDPDYVSKKMVKDYAKALAANIGMRSWKFTHNLVGGLTPGMLSTLNDLVVKGQADGVEVGHFGIEGFRAMMRDMNEDDRGDILGFMDAADVDHSKFSEVIEDVISDLIARFNKDVDPPDDKWLVPADKMDFNDIPKVWRKRMVSYAALASEVEEAINAYDKADGIDSISVGIGKMYVELKYQGLSANDILFELYSSIIGDITSATSAYREPAAMAVLAAMFETCVIFEQNPDTATLVPVDDPAH